MALMDCISGSDAEPGALAVLPEFGDGHLHQMQHHSPRILKISDLAEQPWQNGAGTTRLIAAGAGWRISIATVAAPGAFSLFEHCSRHSVVVAGDGLTLREGAASHSLRPHEIVSYRGDVEWSCTLEGRSASVLNVICDGRLAHASVRKGAALLTEQGDYVMVIPVNCAATCEAQGSAERLVIPAGHVLVLEASSSATCGTDAESPGDAGYLLAVQITLNPMTGSCS